MLDMIDGSGFYVNEIWFTDEAIFIWMVSLTGTTGDFGIPKTHTCLRHDYCIANKLPFGLHFPEKGSLGSFSYMKR